MEMNDGRATFISSGNLGAISAFEFVGKKMVIISKRGTGKSWLITHLIDVLKLSNTFDHLLIVSPTEQHSQCYTPKYGTSAKIYYNLTDADLLSATQYKKPLIILDDCILSKSNKLIYQTLKKILCLEHVTILVAMQNILGLDPDIKSLFDYCIFGKEDFMSNLKGMFDHFNTGFNEFKPFKKAMDNMPIYHFMLIDQNFKVPKKELLPELAHVVVENTKNINDIIRLNYKYLVLTSDSNMIKRCVTDIISNLEEKHKIDDIFLINETGKSDYDNIETAYNINTEPDIIKRILLVSSYMIQKKKPKNFVVILENLFVCFNEKKIVELCEMMYNGRHYNITLIMTETYPTKIDVSMRSNFDMILTNDCWNNSIGKKVYDQYGGMFPDYKVFRKILACIDDNQMFTFIQIQKRAPNHNPWAFVILDDKQIKNQYVNKDYKIDEQINDSNNSPNVQQKLKILDLEQKKSDRQIRLQKIKKLKNSLIGECYLFNADYPDDASEVINSIIKYSIELDDIIEKVYKKIDNNN